MSHLVETRKVVNEVASPKSEVIPQQIPKNVHKANKLSQEQLVFLDFYNEHIFDFYYDLRQQYSMSKLFTRVDYNGFLDIFLKNITVISDECDSEEESGEL